MVTLPVTHLWHQTSLLDHFADKNFSLNRDLFKDKTHLNDRGAKLYPEIITKETGGIDIQ